MRPGDLLILATTHLPKADGRHRPKAHGRPNGMRKSRNYASLVDWINDEIREAARVLNVTLVDQSDILGEGQLRQQTTGYEMMPSMIQLMIMLFRRVATTYLLWSANLTIK